MNRIWNILGIEPTNNEPEIKKAYAVKLRTTKPDENPKAFQQLHKAYQEALRLAKHKVAVEEDEIDTSDEFDSWSVADEEWQSETCQNTDFEAYDDSRDRGVDLELERMLAVVDGLINNPERNRVELWEKILDSQYILDDDYFYPFARAVFDRITEYYNKTEYKILPGEMIHAEVFSWLYHNLSWNEYGYEFLCDNISDNQGKTVLDAVILSRDKSNKDDERALTSVLGGKIVTFVDSSADTEYREYFKQYYASPWTRSFAALIDGMYILVLMLLAFASMEWIFGIKKMPDSLFVTIVVVIVVLWYWLFESSLKHASPGKSTLYLEVFTRDGKPLTYWQGFKRSVITVFVLALYFIIIVNIPTYGIIMFLAIHLFSKEYLQDKLTGTCVISDPLTRHG